MAGWRRRTLPVRPRVPPRRLPTSPGTWPRFSARESPRYPPTIISRTRRSPIVLASANSDLLDKALAGPPTIEHEYYTYDDNWTQGVLHASKPAAQAAPTRRNRAGPGSRATCPRPDSWVTDAAGRLHPFEHPFSSETRHGPQDGRSDAHGRDRHRRVIHAVFAYEEILDWEGSAVKVIGVALDDARASAAVGRSRAINGILRTATRASRNGGCMVRPRVGRS